MLQCVAVCCSVVQRVALCCSVLPIVSPHLYGIPKRSWLLMHDMHHRLGKRDTNYRALLQKMTYEDEASHGSIDLGTSAPPPPLSTAPHTIRFAPPPYIHLRLKLCTGVGILTQKTCFGSIFTLFFGSIFTQFCFGHLYTKNI